MKKTVILSLILCVASVVFGQNNEVFNMIDGLTDNFPITEDGLKKIVLSNGFISVGKDRYINSFEGVSVESWSEDEKSANGTNVTFILKFDNDIYFVRFIREFLFYFSNKYHVSFDGYFDNSNYYVFYNEDDPTSLSMVHNATNKDVIIWVSLNN